MDSTELVLEYLNLFYGEKNIELLSVLFSDDFSFSGPLYEFESADAYINALKNDPPKDMSYKLLHLYKNGSSVCAVYEFSKGKITAMMAQVFEISNNKIDHIQLIFDTKQFIE